MNPSLNDIKSVVSIALDIEPDMNDQEFAAGVVLLAARFVGQHAIRLSKFTGVDRLSCVQIGLNLRSMGIWKRGGFKHNYFDEGGNIKLGLDVLIALGGIKGSTNKAVQTFKIRESNDTSGFRPRLKIHGIEGGRE